MKLIDKDALLTAIDKERQILIEQERFGAEHVVVHHARRLVEDAPTIEAIPRTWICRYMNTTKSRVKAEIIREMLEVWEEEEKEDGKDAV